MRQRVILITGANGEVGHGLIRQLYAMEDKPDIVVMDIRGLDESMAPLVDSTIVGDILELAERYCAEGADELVFYDITASPDSRTVDRDWVSNVARVLDIPFCVAGGIKSVADAEDVLQSALVKTWKSHGDQPRQELLGLIYTNIRRCATCSKKPFY